MEPREHERQLYRRLSFEPCVLKTVIWRGIGCRSQHTADELVVRSGLHWIIGCTGSVRRGVSSLSDLQQDRRCTVLYCTCNVTLGAFVQLVLLWKSNKYYLLCVCVCVCVCVCMYMCVSFWSLCVCVCVLSYPARNAHAPYCHPCRVPLCNIFLRYLTNGTIF